MEVCSKKVPYQPVLSGFKRNADPLGLGQRKIQPTGTSGKRWRAWTRPQWNSSSLKGQDCLHQFCCEQKQSCQSLLKVPKVYSLWRLCYNHRESSQSMERKRSKNCPLQLCDMLRGNSTGPKTEQSKVGGDVSKRDWKAEKESPM